MKEENIVDLDDVKFHVIYGKEDLNEIKDSIAYLIAKGGIYIKRKNNFIDSVTKVDEIPHLADIEEECKFNEIPKGSRIPSSIIEKAIAFFRKVYSMYKSEAILMLTFDGKNWGLFCPEQKVSEAALSYDLTKENVENVKIIGTVHSHADFEASHSSIDDDDEKQFDGIHITIGNVNTVASISCSVVSGGVRDEIKMEEIIDMKETGEFDNAWLKKVKKGGVKVGSRRGEWSFED
jgi:proteasome lid subunit RPN8/RPN11